MEFIVLSRLSLWEEEEEKNPYANLQSAEERRERKKKDSQRIASQPLKILLSSNSPPTSLSFFLPG